MKLSLLARRRERARREFLKHQERLVNHLLLDYYSAEVDYLNGILDLALMDAQESE